MWGTDKDPVSHLQLRALVLWLRKSSWMLASITSQLSFSLGVVWKDDNTYIINMLRKQTRYIYMYIYNRIYNNISYYKVEQLMFLLFISHCLKSKLFEENSDITRECLNLHKFKRYLLSTVDVYEGLCSYRKFLLNGEIFCACLVVPSPLWKKHGLAMKWLWPC